MSYADKSTPELFEILFNSDYDDPHGDLREAGASAALRELKHRPDAAEFAEHFLNSLVATQRERSIDVLAVWGTRREVTIPYLDDPDPGVVESAVYALGSWHGHPPHPAMLVAKDHPCPEVRLAVAKGLLGNMRETPDVLSQLMNDSDGEVRNWATCTLGIQCQYDSPAIRDAFRARLDDSFEDARHEAVWALSRRRDPSGLRLLLDRLEADYYVTGDEQAACDILNLRGAHVDDLCDGLRALLG